MKTGVDFIDENSSNNIVCLTTGFGGGKTSILCRIASKMTKGKTLYITKDDASKSISKKILYALNDIPMSESILEVKGRQSTLKIPNNLRVIQLYDAEDDLYAKILEYIPNYDNIIIDGLSIGRKLLSLFHRLQNHQDKKIILSLTCRYSGGILMGNIPRVNGVTYFDLRCNRIESTAYVDVRENYKVKIIKIITDYNNLNFELYDKERHSSIHGSGS